MSTLAEPRFEPTALLDQFRAAQISYLLTAAVTAFDVGKALEHRPVPFSELMQLLGLKERPAIVLLTALRSLELVDLLESGEIALTEYGREKLAPASAFHLRGYIGLGAFSDGAQQMIRCLRDDKPAGSVSFVVHEDGPASALDDPATANVLARAMADRARTVAPFVAAALDLSGAKCLVDAGGGHGLYAMALLEKHPALTAVVLDRKPALDVARELAESLGMLSRLELRAANLFSCQFPPSTDAVLLANILHDYAPEAAAALVTRFAQALEPGGRLIVLDSFLDPVKPGQPPVSPGPEAVAAYSGLLFSICEGRCYRTDEVEKWLTDAGLTLEDRILTLPAHGGIIIGRKAK